MVKDIRITGQTVALTVNLTTPACPLKAQIEREVRSALTSRLGDSCDDSDQHECRGARQGRVREG